MRVGNDYWKSCPFIFGKSFLLTLRINWVSIRDMVVMIFPSATILSVNWLVKYGQYGFWTWRKDSKIYKFFWLWQFLSSSSHFQFISVVPTSQKLISFLLTYVLKSLIRKMGRLIMGTNWKYSDRLPFLSHSFRAPMSSNTPPIPFPKHFVSIKTPSFFFVEKARLLHFLINLYLRRFTPYSFWRYAQCQFWFS